MRDASPHHAVRQQQVLLIIEGHNGALDDGARGWLARACNRQGSAGNTLSIETIETTKG
jgi:hypothetical protein